jgi:hypothetical protein
MTMPRVKRASVGAKLLLVWNRNFMGVACLEI